MHSNLLQTLKFIFPQNEIECLIENLSQIQSDQYINQKNYDERFQEYLSKLAHLNQAESSQIPLFNQNQEVNQYESYIKILNLLFPKQNDQIISGQQLNPQQNINDKQDSHQIYLLDTLIHFSNILKGQQSNSQQQINNINTCGDIIDNQSKLFSNIDNDSQKYKEYIQKLICTIIFKDLEINSLKQQLQKQVNAQFSQKSDEAENGNAKNLTKINKQLDEIINLIEKKETLQAESSNSSSHPFQNENSFNFEFTGQDFNLESLKQKTETIKNKIEQFLDQMRNSKIQITKDLINLDVDQINRINKIQNKKLKADLRKSKTCISLDSKLQVLNQQHQMCAPSSPKKVFSNQKPTKKIEKTPTETPKRSSIQSNYQSPNNIQNLRRKSSFFLMQKFKTFNESDNRSNLLKLINTDFAGIKNQESIFSQIRKKQNSNSENESYFFSDQVTKFSHSKKSEEKIICLDESSFYVLNTVDSLKGYKKFPIKDISKIIISQSNMNLCSIHIQKEFELIIEISHRESLLKYIINIFQEVLKIDQPIIQNSTTHKQQKVQKEQNILKSALLNHSKQYLDQNSIQHDQQEMNKSFDSQLKLQQ
ncbi:hypothetical protein ABPG74_001331 [Tetrahymena malaccensis]